MPQRARGWSASFSTRFILGLLAYILFLSVIHTAVATEHTALGAASGPHAASRGPSWLARFLRDLVRRPLVEGNRSKKRRGAGKPDEKGEEEDVPMEVLFEEEKKNIDVLLTRLDKNVELELDLVEGEGTNEGEGASQPPSPPPSEASEELVRRWSGALSLVEKEFETRHETIKELYDRASSELKESIENYEKNMPAAFLKNAESGEANRIVRKTKKVMGMLEARLPVMEREHGRVQKNHIKPMKEMVARARVVDRSGPGLGGREATGGADFSWKRAADQVRKAASAARETLGKDAAIMQQVLDFYKEMERAGDEAAESVKNKLGPEQRAVLQGG